MTRVSPSHDFSDSDLPPLDKLCRGTQRQKNPTGRELNFATRTAQTQKPREPQSDSLSKPKTTGTVRKRKLGVQPSNQSLLLPWNYASLRTEGSQKFRADIANRSHRTTVDMKPTAVENSGVDSDGLSDDDWATAREEITFIEEATVADDVSVFEPGHCSPSEDDDDTDEEEEEDNEDQSIIVIRPRSPRKRSQRADTLVSKQVKAPPLLSKSLVSSDRSKKREIRPAKARTKKPHMGQNVALPLAKPSLDGKAAPHRAGDLTNALSRLRIEADRPQVPDDREKMARSETPSLTSPQPLSSANQVSPKRRLHIPTTPHRPSSDMFWCQEFVDEWNDEHSPVKKLFPKASKSSVKTAGQKDAACPKPSAQQEKPQKQQREAKKAFEMYRNAMAENFLQELDTTITGGQLTQLAASTGGIRLIWTNKLQTTAGRANWKRETLNKTWSTTSEERHHASIELSEKVIRNEERLLNVVAHEFCHLANFMIHGLTARPHGREFKDWAARCSRAFGDRGIEVTTRHAYEIDFKYVWTCEACCQEFKRQSKSIDPERQRCGVCKGLLRQTKPVPRGGNVKGECGAAVAKKPPSAYQSFVKEHMKRVREENPGSPQKDIMRLVADKWAREGKAKANAGKGPAEPAETLDGIAGKLNLVSVRDG